jgi:hypothetical protein
MAPRTDLAAAFAPFAGPALFLQDLFDRTQEGTFVSGAARRAAPIAQMAVLALALILLGAFRQGQSRRTAGQEALAAQQCCRCAR